MGAWGEGPTDNNTAADALGDFVIDARISKRINKMLKSEDYDVRRAGAHLLESLARVYVYDDDDLIDDLSYAISRLQDILEDDWWISTWQDPGAIKKSIKLQIKNLKSRWPTNSDVSIEESVAKWQREK